MVRGAVLQLAAVGEQNKVLTGCPQMSYFVSVYRRHTNFTYQDIKNYWSGQIDFGKKIYCKLNKIGDLISSLTLSIQLPDLSELNTNTERPVSWINGIGHAIIREYEIKIGDNIIDKRYGLWLEIWSELAVPEDKRNTYNRLVGKHNTFNNSLQTGQMALLIPLRFWFTEEPSLALPIIALQRQDVILSVTLKEASSLITGYYPKFHKPLLSADLYVRYYFLDDSERKVFAKTKQTYIIEQLQVETLNKNQDLGLTTFNNVPTAAQFEMSIPFNHPIKEIIWTVQRQDAMFYIENYANGIPVTPPYEYWNNIFNFSNVPEPDSTPGNNNTVLFANLRIEGNDYFQEDKNMSSVYWRLIQPAAAHTRVPINRHIYLYSFALKPEAHQPSGTYNFSKIDHRYLRLLLNPKNITNSDTNEYIINVFATNYNILTIEHGVGTLEYIM